MDFQYANGNIQWKDESQMLYRVFLVCWKIMLDYGATDKSCLQNPVKK
jgi:hypothetical protein